jgi:hypothetical protein
MGIRRLRLPPSHPGPAACEIRPPEPGHRGVHRDRIDARSQLVRSMRVLRRRPRMDAGPGRTPRHGVEVGTRPARARPHVPADRSRRVPGRCRPKRRQEPGGLPSRQMRQGMRHPSGHPGPHHQRAGNRHRRTGSPLQRLPPVSRASSERHRCSPAIQKLCFGASRTARPPPATGITGPPRSPRGPPDCNELRYPAIPATAAGASPRISPTGTTRNRAQSGESACIVRVVSMVPEGVKWQPSKLVMRVRFPSPALIFGTVQEGNFDNLCDQSA